MMKQCHQALGELRTTRRKKLGQQRQSLLAIIKQKEDKLMQLHGSILLGRTKFFEMSDNRGRSAFQCGEQKNDVGPATLALRREIRKYVVVPFEKFHSTLKILMKEGQVTFVRQKMEFGQCDFRRNWTMLLMQ
jgi:hypothetical protein